MRRVQLWQRNGRLPVSHRRGHCHQRVCDRTTYSDTQSGQSTTGRGTAFGIDSSETTYTRGVWLSKSEQV
jgi:hypothetical protein